MAPIEDFQSRDLAWISDFVMQQMVIMLRPMMDHLQETDAACDYASRMVHRVSMDVSEVRGDLERTNKYLAVLRQGLGVQNEGKCMLQRSLETSTRTVKRLDDQMETMLSVQRGVEDSIRQLNSDQQGGHGRHEDLAKQVSAGSATLEELQASVELLTGEQQAVKDGLLLNETKLEVSQRELRELRRGQLNIVPKLEDKGTRPPPTGQSGKAAPAAAAVDTAPWPQKKGFSAAVDPISASVSGSPAGLRDAGNLTDTGSNHSGSRQESKRVSRVGSGTGPGLRLQQTCPVGIGCSGKEGGSLNASGSLDESSATASRLPLLASTRATTRAEDHNRSESGHHNRSESGHGRLRFSATLAKPESRGKPS